MIAISTFAKDDTIITYKDTLDFRSLIRPAYPMYAVEYGIQGPVKYKFHINIEMCVDSIVIISSPGQILSQAVIKSLKETDCKWTKKNGEPIDVWIDDVQEFKIE